MVLQRCRLILPHWLMLHVLNLGPQQLLRSILLLLLWLVKLVLVQVEYSGDVSKLSLALSLLLHLINVT